LGRYRRQLVTKMGKWTGQQRQAIKHRGSGVVVAASAGTGKTSVLSDRCVDILCDRTQPGDVRSMLVVTFTKAAAQEMRSRIAAKLRQQCLQQPNAHLHRQLLLLDAADISTLHAFCQRLIGRYFYRLGIDPAFRIIDADEKTLIEAEILDATIEWAWGQSNLRPGLRELLGGRDIYGLRSGFLSNVIKINEFLEGVVSRDKWYAKALALGESSGSYLAEMAGKQQQIILRKLRQCLSRFEYSRDMAMTFCPFGPWTQQLEDDFIEPVEEFIDLCTAGDITNH